MAIPNPTESCFYRIQEGTRNEFVAVGWNGNILRWQETGGPEQEWLIIPVSDSRCRIMTRSNGEYMSVGSNGNILRWGFSAGPEQQFSFLNERNGRWNIQEGTQGEFVAVGSNGDVLRWAQSNRPDQEFRLVPVPGSPKPVVRTGIFTPTTIPGPPRTTSTDVRLPSTSPLYLIGEITVPAVLVDDSGTFSDAIVKVERNPYYKLAREMYYDNGPGRGYVESTDGTARTIAKTIKHGVSVKDSESMERTIGTKVTASGQINLSVTGSGLTVGGMASIASEWTSVLKVSRSHDRSTMHEETRALEVALPAGAPLTRVGWSLVDRYSLARADGSLVAQWEVVDGSKFFEDSFPTPPHDNAVNLPDGKLVREQSSAPVYVVFGGAKFHVPNPTVLHEMYGGWAFVNVVNDGELRQVPTTPRDGTVLKERTDPRVFVMRNKEKCWIPDPTVLQRYGGWSAVRVLHDGALAALPDGPAAP